MSAAQDVEALLAKLGSRLRFAGEDEAPRPLSLGSLGPLGWPGLGDALPEGGLPRGVVELAAPRALGGSTAVAMAAVRAGQARERRAWCAWIDPESTLHAPGVVAAGVDLARMLVVAPPRAQLGKVAVKVVASGAFEVVVVDVDPVPCARVGAKSSVPRTSVRGEVLVRKLALASESSGTTVLLLTDSTRPRAAAWPVALRLELSRPDRDSLAVRVAKDRRGRIGLAKTVPFLPVVRTPRSGADANENVARAAG